MQKAANIGASGKLGRSTTDHGLARGDNVVGVSRPESVGRLVDVADRLTFVPGRPDDREVSRRAVEGCGGEVTFHAPSGAKGCATGTGQAIPECADPQARLNLSCGWQITRDGKHAFRRSLRWQIRIFSPLVRGLRFADSADDVRAGDRIFAGDCRSSAVRGRILNEGSRRGMPLCQRHVDSLARVRNRASDGNDARPMVEARADDAVPRKAPAISGGAEAA